MKVLLKFAVYALIAIFIIFLLFLQATKLPSYGSWGIYHYYINSKYFQELGYFNLYSCSIDSMKDKNIWSAQNLVRDLNTYSIIRVADLAKCSKNNFTNARWGGFQKDNTLIMSKRSPSYWNYVVDDKGFNPPPSWAAVAGTVANLIPINNPSYYLIFNLDIVFIILASLVVYFSAGKFASILTLILSLIYFGSFGALFNNLFQYTWFPCIALSVYWWKNKKPFASGLALGVASGLQAFPAVFAIPVVLLFAVSLLRHRVKDINLSSLFIFGFVSVLFVSFILGSVYSHRAGIWSEWYNKISIQREYLNGEVFDIGFSNLVGKVFSSDQSDSFSYLGDYSHAKTRATAFNDNKLVYYSIVALGVFLILYIFWKSQIYNPFIYGYFLMYLFLSLSPYYYLVLALIPYMFWDSTARNKKLVIEATIILFITELLLFWKINAVSFYFIYQLVSEILIFAYLIFLSFVCLVGSKKSY